MLHAYVQDRIIRILEDKDTRAYPIKVFIKREPHKQSKIDEGRYRIISGVSLVDAIIDRMLWQDTVDKIIWNVGKTPLMIGWSPLCGGGAWFRRLFPRKTFDVDVSHWDWTYPVWLLRLAYGILLGTVQGKPNWFVKLAMRRYLDLFVDARFKFADGMEVQQPYEGVLKSGCYLTTVLNSLGQWLLNEMAMEWISDQVGQTIDLRFVCLGDDSTRESSPYNDLFVKFYESLGLKIKSHENEIPEFCGFYVGDFGHTSPAYVNKHKFMLSHLTCDEELAKQTLEAYQYLYWDTPEMLSVITAIAVARGYHDIILGARELRRVCLRRSKF
nr:VP2 [Bayan-Khairhan-Ula Melophagus solemo-like virus]